jgi:hypothetical protein
MTVRRRNDDERADEAFLSRWSRLKREEPQREPEKESAAEKEQAKPLDPPPGLPPVDKLTPESDFSAFMGPKVQDTLRRVALKKLFTDPHFNAPDLFEPYSGDWTVGEPIPEEMLRTLNQARTHLFPEEKKREEAEERERLAAEAAARAPAEDGAGESHAATIDTLEEKHDEPGRQDT